MILAAATLAGCGGFGSPPSVSKIESRFCGQVASCGPLGAADEAVISCMLEERCEPGHGALASLPAPDGSPLSVVLMPMPAGGCVMLKIIRRGPWTYVQRCTNLRRAASCPWLDGDCGPELISD